MKFLCASRARVACIGFLTCFLLSAHSPSDALAQWDFSIVRIEEDWELVVATPETTCNSPQITCAMSPVGNDDAEYMSFELNHKSQPGYGIGGLALHAWNGEYLHGSSHSNDTLQTSDELISWTQSMTVSEGMLTYEVTNGSSITWGTFGTGELNVSVPTNLSNLHSYNINYSVNSSGVGFGANRVSSLTLKRVRFITGSGFTFEFSVNYDVLGE